MSIASIGRPIDAVLSTLAGCQHDVGVGEFGNKQLGIKAAFGGTDFDYSFHLSVSGSGTILFTLLVAALQRLHELGVDEHCSPAKYAFLDLLIERVEARLPTRSSGR